MIDSRELRIGNWVTDEFFDTFKTFIKVDSINNKGINLEIEDDGKWAEIAKIWIGCEYNFESLFGIPLTEEILLKCGFGKWLGLYSQNTFTLSTNNHIEYEHTQTSVKIKYLHELQNLYFAIKKEELTIHQ